MMPTLVLELRQGEMLIINGAPMRFRTRSIIELTQHARFLFGKQVMAPFEANSPARRIYFALQTAYIGTEDERETALATALGLIAEFKEATTSEEARQILDAAYAHAQADECYPALKCAKRIIRHEESVLPLPETFAAPRPKYIRRGQEAIPA